MPDIERIPSELATGLFNDRLLATRLDTQERLSSLYGDVHIPDITYIPKDLSTDGILASDKVPPLNDYITSTDPKMRDIGKDYMLQGMANNQSLKSGIGLDRMVKYQAGQEKFTNQHWWSESGKTKFGFNPDVSLAENEDFYKTHIWDNYSMFGKAWRFTGTTALRVLSKFATGVIGGVGTLYSMITSGSREITEAYGGPKNNFWLDVSDNVLARAMRNVDDYVKQEIVPTYKAINYDNKGAFSKLMDPYLWQSDMADGAGFLLQFALPAMGLGKLTQLSKLAVAAEDANVFQKILAAGVGETATAGRFAKATGTALEGLTGSRNVGGMTAHMFNTVMESVSETTDGLQSNVKDLMGKGYSEKDARRISAEHAPTQFGLNMFILSLSGALENKWFQQAAGNRRVGSIFTRELLDESGNVIQSRAERKIASAILEAETVAKNAGKTAAEIKLAGEDAAKIAEKASKGFLPTMGRRISFYGKEGVKATIMEGYWEENAQQAATRVAAGSYMRRGDDTDSQGILTNAKPFFEQLWQQTVDAYHGNDKEVADSIMAGAVMGILGGAGFAKLAGERQKGHILPLGERKTEEHEHATLVANIKNAKAAWMNVDVMTGDLYNADGSFNEDKVKERTLEINAKLEKIQSMFARKVEIDDITDPEKREYLQHVLFGDFLRGHIMHGTGEELISRIKNWTNKTPGELAIYGVTGEMAEDPKKWADIAQHMYDDYHKIEALKFNNPLKLSKEDYFSQLAGLRVHIFDYTMQKYAATNAANRYADLENEMNPFTKTPSVFSAYNMLAAKVAMYTDVINNENLDNDTKKIIQQQLDKQLEELNLLGQNLPEHVTSSDSIFKFDKGTDIKLAQAEIDTTLGHYQNAVLQKEIYLATAAQAHSLVKEYSDPATGLSRWNDKIKLYNNLMAKIKIEKLKDKGYTQEEAEKMTPEEQDRILIGDIKKEQNPEIKAEEAVKAEEEKAIQEEKDRIKAEEQAKKEEEAKTSTLEGLREQLIQIFQAADPNVNADNLDRAIERFLKEMGNLEVEIPQEVIDLITAYNTAKVDTLKTEVTGQFTEEAVNEPTPTVEDAKETSITEIKFKNAVEAALNTKDGDILRLTTTNPSSKGHHSGTKGNTQTSSTTLVKVGDIFVEQEDINKTGRDRREYKPEDLDKNNKTLTISKIGESIITTVNDTSVEEAGMVPPSLLDEVRQAYRLHQQAIENETTFKEEADKEGLIIHNNRIDNNADNGKNEGTINVVTSNPKDIEKGTIRTSDNNIARFNFLDKLASGKLRKEDYKLVLSISKKGEIYGVVADKDGNFVKFDEVGSPFAQGSNLLFYLDGFDLYSEQNIGKRRSDVVAPPFALAPLTATPISLHPSFNGVNVLSTLKNVIANGKVTASINFVTQGMLYREGTNNSYTIPKGKTMHMANELFSRGHMSSEKGNISSENITIHGIYQRSMRINFDMYKDLNKPSAGTESVEFHPVSIAEAKNNKGEKLIDILKAENGENIFEAAIKGNLEATVDNMRSLETLLRPDMFKPINLGTVILLVDLKNFKKFLTSGKITIDELKSITKLEDIYKSPLNISKAYYDSRNELPLQEEILREGNENYSNFINANVATSSIPIKTSPNIEGYARVNKRMAITLDNDMNELTKIQNQEAQTEKSPSTTIVKVGETLSDDEILKAFNNPDPTLNLGDVTKDDC